MSAVKQQEIGSFGLDLMDMGGMLMDAKKVPAEKGDDYTMDHVALVYLMDKQSRFVAPFSLKRKPEEAAADLRRYM